MPYEVICPPGTAATVHKSIGTFLDKEDGTVWHKHKGDVYESGAILEDDLVSPVTVALYEAGDEYVRSILKRLPKGTKAKAKDEDFVEVPVPAFDPQAEQVAKLPRVAGSGRG